MSGAAGAAEPLAPPSPGVIIRLWDGPAPNAPKTEVEETTDNDGRVKNVSVPTLTAYLPDKAVATGTAIIVCSGGGYSQLAVKKHGEGAAAVFVPRGIAVFALKYRLQPISKNVVADACADGERALRLARSRAGEWNLDPQRIGIIGYSAGANLILNLLSNFDDGEKGSTDANQGQSGRPDFVGLFSASLGDRFFQARVEELGQRGPMNSNRTHGFDRKLAFCCDLSSEGAAKPKVDSLPFPFPESMRLLLESRLTR